MRCAGCRYDLARFSPVNAVGFDHPDPSIFTVLTVPSDRPGACIESSIQRPDIRLQHLNNCRYMLSVPSDRQSAALVSVEVWRYTS